MFVPAAEEQVVEMGPTATATAGEVELQEVKVVSTAEEEPQEPQEVGATSTELVEVSATAPTSTEDHEKNSEEDLVNKPAQQKSMEGTHAIAAKDWQKPGLPCVFACCCPPCAVAAHEGLSMNFLVTCGLEVCTGCGCCFTMFIWQPKDDEPENNKMGGQQMGSPMPASPTPVRADEVQVEVNEEEKEGDEK